MLVEVGPVTSASVLSWCAYAREALEGFGRHAKALQLPDGVGSRFEMMIAEWEARAGKSDVFKWVAEFSLEETEYLANALRGAAAELVSGLEQGTAPRLPQEAEEFYDALVTGFLDALRSEGGAASQFAEWLLSDWPGEAGRRLK